MSKIDVDDLIDECIDNLCDDNAETGAESLVELARYWSKAGMPIETFYDIRKYIVDQSINRLGSQATDFIYYKLKQAEKSLEDARNHSGIH